MGIRQLTTCFQRVKYASKSSKLIILGALLAFILTPSHPLRGGSVHWVELFEYEKQRETSDLLKIYSVLRSYRMDLRDAEAWEISETILTESLNHALDPMLVLAVINVESHFQHTAVSTKGARGLMQILPFVAEALLQEIGPHLASDEIFKPDSLDDPILNIKLGVFYLQGLKRNFRDVKVALTAYNWGPTAIRNRLDRNEALPFGYATKVLSTYQSFRRDNNPVS